MNGGRLGNVMFTLAAAYAHSLKVGSELRVPWNFNAHSALLGQYLNYPFRLTYHGLERGYSPTTAVYEEPNFHYTPIPECVNSGHLKGYFQSYKYFDGFEDEVRNLYFPFVFPGSPRTFGVHVRLTDYRRYQRYVSASPEFIAAAFKDAGGWLNVDKVLVFSDEPESAIRIVQQAIPDAMENRICSSRGDIIRDLSTMTTCDYLAISSSTFGWWGAWLSRAKKIYVPKNWFGTDEFNTEDVCPPDWIRL